MNQDKLAQRAVPSVISLSLEEWAGDFRFMTPSDFRALFPSLKSFVWLNAAASSPLSTPVAEAVQSHLEEWKHQGDLGFSKWLTQKESVRARLARFVGAQPSQLALTPSTSFGFHVIARMLKARGISEVLSLEHEFPSTTVPLLYEGLTIRGVRRRADGSYPLSDIEAALRASTGAVAVSLVQFNSGFRVDIEGLSALCKSRNLPLALNAAQAAGHVPIDFSRWRADFLSFTSHKWMGAGAGLGTLVVADSWLEELPLAGWLSVEASQLWKTFPDPSRVDDERGFLAKGARIRREASALETGGGVWLNCHALDAALGLHEALGAHALPHIHRLQRLLRAGLRSRGFVPNAPDDEACSSGICVIPVAGAPEDAVRALLKEKIVTTPRGGGLRISTHAYNSEEDVHRLLTALDLCCIRP